MTFEELVDRYFVLLDAYKELSEGRGPKFVGFAGFTPEETQDVYRPELTKELLDEYGQIPRWMYKANPGVKTATEESVHDCRVPQWTHELLKDENKELRSLAESVLRVIESWPTEGVFQEEWKKDWLCGARKILHKETL